MLHGDTSSFGAANAPNRSNEEIDPTLNDWPVLQAVRLFPGLPEIPLLPATANQSAIEHTKAALLDITREMVGPTDGDEGTYLGPTPAGYTYFGQFVFHDIVFSQIFGLRRPTGEVHHLKNASSQGLDLSGLYGRGPTVDAHLYDVPDGHDLSACRFPIGLPRMKDRSCPIEGTVEKGRDLPRIDMSGRFLSVKGRKRPYRPLVADPRNDDNLVLSQLLCTLMCAHNRIVDLLLGETETCGNAIAGEGTSPAEAYRRAKAYLTAVYRNAVIGDYLKRIMHPDVWAYFFENHVPADNSVSALATYNALPLEFTFGASRFAHAMVRQSYAVNENSAEERASLRKMLSFSSLRPDCEIPIPVNWTIDWRRFVRLDGGQKVQSARRISPFLSKELTIANLSAELDGTARPVAFMDCWRCYDLGLPSGQTVAETVRAVLGAKRIIVETLTEEEMLPTEACSRRYVYNAGRLRGALLRHDKFLTETPLSYYIMQEAAVKGDDGAYLGPVGSYIVGATVAAALFRSVDFDPNAGRLIPDVEPKTLGGLLSLGDSELMPDDKFARLVRRYAV